MAEEIRIEVFAEQTRFGPEDVLTLWRRDEVLPAAEAARRVGEVLLVARRGERELVGVSTAYLVRNSQLGMDLWAYRVYVAETARASEIARHFALLGRDHLRERYVAGIDRRGAGFVLEVEHEGLRRRFQRAVWRRHESAFIGWNEWNEPVRVYYFPGARAPLPA